MAKRETMDITYASLRVGDFIEDSQGELWRVIDTGILASGKVVVDIITALKSVEFIETCLIAEPDESITIRRVPDEVARRKTRRLSGH